MNIMATTKKKVTVNTQKKRIKDLKITLKKVIKLQRKRKREEERNRDELQRQPANN